MPPAYDNFGAVQSDFWTEYAAEYLREHGEILGDAHLLWCPEGLTEDEAGLLGEVADRDVLEVGCGAGQGSRWVASHGGRATGIDISPGMLAHARRVDEPKVRYLQADARSLPFDPSSFDIAFTAFGALPFLPDPGVMFREVARVLRGGGLFAFSTSHPMRWVFPDDPNPDHLRVVRRYFEPEPYTEETGGRLSYAEFQHTFEDLVAGLLGAGFAIEEVREPRWVEGNSHVWGSWSPQRAPWVPGTLIVRARLK